MEVVQRVQIEGFFDCSLERAFKSPMLCDVAKVHTGYGPMPRVTHCEEDARWGEPGHSKRVFAARSFAFSGGEYCLDKVVERRDNAYWKIEVSQFRMWSIGFTRFVGEWETQALPSGQIHIVYTYTLCAPHRWLFPVQWLFAKIFWKRYMRQVLENVRKLAYTEEPYRHA